MANYLRAEDLDEALAALATAPLTIAAGCTDLFPATDRQTLPGDILDITAVPELRGISEAPEGLRIGAATTWSDIANAGLSPALKALQLAAREVGARQIQNSGTIGGNLCNASPAADGAPPLMIVDAEVEIASIAGARRIALGDFINGPRSTALGPDELLTAVIIPEASLGGVSAFRKLGARKHLVISIAMTAARVVLCDGVIAEAALAVGACGPVATRLPAVEAALVGQTPASALIDPKLVYDALNPIDDIRGDAAYRAEAAVELLRRTIADLSQHESVAA